MLDAIMINVFAGLCNLAKELECQHAQYCPLGAHMIGPVTYVRNPYRVYMGLKPYTCM